MRESRVQAVLRHEVSRRCALGLGAGGVLGAASRSSARYRSCPGAWRRPKNRTRTSGPREVSEDARHR